MLLSGVCIVGASSSGPLGIFADAASPGSGASIPQVCASPWKSLGNVQSAACRIAVIVHDRLLSMLPPW